MGRKWDASFSESRMADNLDISNVIDELAKNRKFLVFAGTGVNTGTGIPESWRILIKSLYEKRPIEGIDAEKVDEEDFPEVAQKLYESFKSAKEENLYYESIRSNLQATNAPFSTQQTQIWKSVDRVVTTNFDDSFESAFEDNYENNPKPISKNFLPHLNSQVLSGGYSISYIHGRIDEKAIVFKLDDYVIFYPSVSGNTTGSDNLERFLRDIYEREIIVFVGFGFNDDYVIRSLENTCDQIVKNDDAHLRFGRPTSRYEQINHYAFMHKKDIKDRPVLLDRLKAIKINVIIYDKHSEWIEWFKKLRMLRRTVYDRNLMMQGSEIDG